MTMKAEPLPLVAVVEDPESDADEEAPPDPPDPDPPLAPEPVPEFELELDDALLVRDVDPPPTKSPTWFETAVTVPACGARSAVRASVAWAFDSVTSALSTFAWATAMSAALGGIVAVVVVAVVAEVVAAPLPREPDAREGVDAAGCVVVAGWVVVVGASAL
jgi:hypothetical protein